MQNKKRKLIFDAKEILYGLKTPVVKDSQVCYEIYFLQYACLIMIDFSLIIHLINGYGY